jgi:hypothetical protein
MPWRYLVPAVGTAIVLVVASLLVFRWALPGLVPASQDVWRFGSEYEVMREAMATMVLGPTAGDVDITSAGMPLGEGIAIMVMELDVSLPASEQEALLEAMWEDPEEGDAQTILESLDDEVMEKFDRLLSSTHVET